MIALFTEMCYIIGIIKERTLSTMKKFISEFKEFISKGNVMDLAVGVIIGGAFQAIVNSLVNDIIMPILGAIFGGLDFSHWVLTLGKGKIIISL